MNSSTSKGGRGGWGWKVATAAGLVACVTGVASAQQAQHRFDKPINQRQGETGAGNRQVHVEMSQSDNDDTYTVKIENGAISASHNGKELPANRIRKNDGKVELLDENGKVVSTFHVGKGDINAEMTIKDDAGQREGQKPAGGVFVAGDQPKVMIGINMGDVSDSLREHLKIEGEGGIQLERVIEGLPGANAGLQEKDIIIELEGIKPITQEKFREVLKKKNPGDKVQVKVLRKGDTKECTIKLEAWDAEKLGMAQQNAPGVNLMWGDEAQAKKWAEQAMKNAEKMREGWNAQGFDKNDPKWREHLDMLKKFQGEDGNQWLFNLQPDQFQMFTPMDAEANKRVEQRLKKVEDRLDKLADRLERLADLMEKQQKAGGR